MNRVHRENGGNRSTQHINRVPAVNIHHATRFAESRGAPLNVMVTVNFTELEVAGEASVVFRKLLCQRFSPWLRRSAPNRLGFPPTYVWTMENASATTATHWLVHIPASALKLFEGKVVQWLEGLTGHEVLHRTVQIKRVYNVIGARRYILKGVNPVWADHLGVRASDQGIVNGKRSGFSRNLGPLARKAAGYIPRRHGHRTGT